MKSDLGGDRRPGVTLLELLVVMAILTVLAGILYASAGEVRERGRRTVCISNLRQIGVALAMYRQDYNGTDSPGWPAEMGFPLSHWDLNKVPRPGGGRYLLRSDAIFFCPNFQPQPWESAGSYGWIPWQPRDQLLIPALPPMPEVVARRGSDFPVMYCSLHDFPPPDRPAKTRFVVVLRLDGRVTASHVASGNSWEW